MPTRTNPKSEKNIKRIDKDPPGATHGYQVYFKRAEKEYTKFFSDSKFRSPEDALEAARRFRDRAEPAIPQPKNQKGTIPSTRSRNSRNKTGHIGLHYRHRKKSDGSIAKYIVAVAAPAPMKQVKKEFLLTNKDEKTVIAAALNWRDSIVITRSEIAKRDQDAWNEALAALTKRHEKHMRKTNRLRVFLCHSKDDKEQVKDLYKRLLALGCSPWLDEESLLPGQDWDNEIRKAIKECHVFIACLSSGSITKRGYVQKEIRFAVDIATEIPDEHIFIIPLKMEPCTPPQSLSKWHWLEAYKDGYGKLISSLAQQSERLGLEPLQT